MHSKSAVLANCEDLQVRLTCYSAGYDMPVHAHNECQISYLLAGSIIESSGCETADVFVPARGAKPPGCDHATRVGPNGALILSLNIDAALSEQELGHETWSWRKGKQEAHLKDEFTIVRQLMSSKPMKEEDRFDFIWDLAGLSLREGPRQSGTTGPQWLDQLKEALDDAPEDVQFGTEAERIGIHQAHLSRAFTNRFGIAPSQYRSRARMMRGISHLTRGTTPAEAAIRSGFSDQSHFSRFLERETGVTPARLARFFN